MMNEYNHLCKCIGGWTDWFQGAGGNISVKDEKTVVLKKSGATVSSANSGLACNLQKILDALSAGSEDTSNAVMDDGGIGTPSIEAFLHAFPPRIIVHAHPYPLLTRLCSSDPIDALSFESKTVDYCKPGIPLAIALMSVYEERIHVYFLRNHGIVITGETVDDIIHRMHLVSNEFFAESVRTNVKLASSLFDVINKRSMDKNSYIVKTFFPGGVSTGLGRIFMPYTPDIAVFLRESPIILEHEGQTIEREVKKYIDTYSHLPSVVLAKGVFYVIGRTPESCYNIYEIVQSYIEIEQQQPTSLTFLTPEQVCEIVNWDKEKLRQNS